MHPKVKATLDSFVYVFGEKASKIKQLQLYFADKDSVEGRDRATLIPVIPTTDRVTFDHDQSLTIDEIDRLISLKEIDSQKKVEIYAHLLKKEIRFQIDNAGDQG